MAGKTCSKCGINKPLDDFYTRRDNKHGVTARCKECTKENRRAEYAHTKKHGKTMAQSRWEQDMRNARNEAIAKLLS